MHSCKQNCSSTGLCAAFAETTGRLDCSRLMAALTCLGDYAADSGRRLCEIDTAKMAGFVRLLNNRASAFFTADDIHRVLYIIRLFYDYLQAQGCVAANPLAQLRRQAIGRLLQRLQGRVGRKEDTGD